MHSGSEIGVFPAGRGFRLRPVATDNVDCANGGCLESLLQWADQFRKQRDYTLAAAGMARRLRADNSDALLVPVDMFPLNGKNL